MMNKKISQSKENKEESTKESLESLKAQVLYLQDRANLSDETYFRQQLLILLERIARAEEWQVKVLKDSLANSDNEETEQQEDDIEELEEEED